MCTRIMCLHHLWIIYYCLKNKQDIRRHRFVCFLSCFLPLFCPKLDIKLDICKLKSASQLMWLLYNYCTSLPRGQIGARILPQKVGGACSTGTLHDAAVPSKPSGPPSADHEYTCGITFISTLLGLKERKQKKANLWNMVEVTWEQNDWAT